MYNVLTIFAKAKHSNCSEDVYYTRRNKLYVKLFDTDTSKTLVCEPVATVKQALDLLKNFCIHEIETSCNTDVSNRIDKLSSSISKQFYKRLVM